MRKYILSTISLAFATGACTTPQYNYTPAVESFSRPPIGEVVTVSVGEEMLSQGNIVTQDGILISGEATISGYTLHGGFYPQVGRDEISTFHSFVHVGRGVSNVDGALSANVFMDPPASVQARLDANRLCVVTVLNVAACRDREFQRTQRTLATDNAFQQTLIYSGRIGGEIHIGYREFSGNVARPAFSNDVRYDMDVSMEIAYRGAIIEIIEATNTHITYRVVRNFNTR